AHRDWCPLVVQSDGEVNLVPVPSPGARRGVGCLLISLWKQRDPWAFQFAQKLHAHLNLLNRLGVRRPHHLASRFLFASLNSDGVADPEVMLDLAEQRASTADVVSASTLGKRTTVRSHAPHPHV